MLLLDCCPNVWGEEAAARVQGASKVTATTLVETVSVGQEGRCILCDEAMTVCGDEQ